MACRKEASSEVKILVLFIANVASFLFDKAVERMLQGRLHWLWGVFSTSFPNLKIGLQTGSFAFSCVTRKLGQKPPNFLSGEFVHSGDPGG